MMQPPVQKYWSHGNHYGQVSLSKYVIHYLDQALLSANNALAKTKKKFMATCFKHTNAKYVHACTLYAMKISTDKVLQTQ